MGWELRDRQRTRALRKRMRLFRNTEYLIADSPHPTGYAEDSLSVTSLDRGCASATDRQPPPHPEPAESQQFTSAPDTKTGTSAMKQPEATDQTGNNMAKSKSVLTRQPSIKAPTTAATLHPAHYQLTPPSHTLNLTTLRRLRREEPMDSPTALAEPHRIADPIMLTDKQISERRRNIERQYGSAATLRRKQAMGALSFEEYLALQQIEGLDYLEKG